MVGVEADAQYMDLQRTGVQSIFRPAFNPNVLTNTYRTDLSFLGTVRGRVGYAFDRVFVYGTGGFAYGDVTQRVGFQTGAPLTYFGSRSRYGHRLRLRRRHRVRAADRLLPELLPRPAP